MERMKRAVSLFLCFVMVIGMLPPGALTANAAGTEEDTTYVLAGGDFQEAGDHATAPRM